LIGVAQAAMSGRPPKHRFRLASYTFFSTIDTLIDLDQMMRRGANRLSVRRVLVIAPLIYVLLSTSSACALISIREAGETVYLWPNHNIRVFDGSRAHSTAVRKAVQVWDAARIGRRFVLTGRRGAQVIVTDVSRLGGEADAEGTEGYAPGYVDTIRILTRLSPDENATEVVSHEFGHILGLEHTHGICSVMTPSGRELCPTTGPQPWLRFCRILQPVDVRAAAKLYGGVGVVARPYCPRVPSWDGSIELDHYTRAVDITAGAKMTAVVAQVGAVCGEGAALQGGVQWVLMLPPTAGCVVVYGLYPQGHRSIATRFYFEAGGEPSTPVSEQLPALTHDPLEWDFNSDGLGPWMSSDPSRWQLTTEAEGGNGGTYSVSDSPYGDYPNGQTAYLTDIQPFSLSGRTDCHVAVALRYDLASGDYFSIDMSTDEGATWTPATTPLTGSSEGIFLEPIYEVNSFNGDPTVTIRLGLHANANESADGVYVYKVDVYCLGVS
jgi:hypothetical protein